MGGVVVLLVAVALFLGLSLRLLAWSDAPLARPLSWLASTLLDHPVEVRAAQLEWQGVWPALELGGVRLGYGDEALYVDRLVVLVSDSPWPMAAASGAYGIEVYLQGPRIKLIEDAETGWVVGGVPEFGGSEGPLRLPAYVEVGAAEVIIAPRGRPEFALDGLDSVVEFDGRRIVAKVEWTDSVIALPGVFAQPVPINRAQALFQAGVGDDGGWRVELQRGRFSNDTLSATLRGRLESSAAHGPQLLLYAALLDPVQVAELVEYIPPRLTPEPVYNWLTMALQGGRLEGAELLFQGDPSDYPFAANAGVFQMRSRFRDAELLYQDDWPVISDMDVDLQVDNTALRVEGHHGRTCGARLHDVELQIDDLRQAVIELYGEAQGTADNALCFLTESPVGPDFVADPPLEFALEGPLAVDLDLWLPLTDAVAGGTEYRSGIELQGVELQVEPFLTLNRIDGALEVNNQGIRDLHLEGDWGGNPVAVTAGMTTHSGRQRTVGEVTAFGSPASLIGGMEPADVPWLQGATEWRLRFIAPTFSSIATDPRLELSLSSTLAGVAIDMPPPFGLDKQQARELRVDALITGDGIDSYSLRYGELLSSLGRAGADALPEAMGVHFGGGTASLPDSGIKATGRIAAVDVAAWQRWAGQYILAAKGRQSAGAGGSAGTRQSAPAGEDDGGGLEERVPWPISLDLTCANLILLGREYGVQRLTAHAGANGRGWLELDGDLASGEVSWRGGGAKLRADLEHVDIPVRPRSPALAPASAELPPAQRDAGDTGDTGDPGPRLAMEDAGSLPELEGRVQNLRLGGRNAGTAVISLHPGEDGRSLFEGDLHLQGESIEAQLSAYWRDHCEIGPYGHCTDLQLVLLAADVAELLGLFGAPPAVTGASVDLRSGASWPGSPLDFSLSALHGSITLTLNQGRIRKINPGAGRLVGLLGVRMLPRRIFLDFDDMFGEGLQFDSLKGDYVLTGDGKASIESMRIDSSLAQVTMSGGVDYVQGVYDAQLLVEPRIAATLPVLGLLLGGGVGGATGLLADWIFGGGVDRAVAMRYRITGPWSEPELTKVKAQDKEP